ncbi:MAG: hypothetical protein GY705_30180 [Bacteroidetes bacterium]|nr:hypothetical protein [Bacteroidota bacterium]
MEHHYFEIIYFNAGRDKVKKRTNIIYITFLLIVIFSFSLICPNSYAQRDYSSNPRGFGFDLWICNTKCDELENTKNEIRCCHELCRWKECVANSYNGEAAMRTECQPHYQIYMDCLEEHRKRDKSIKKNTASSGGRMKFPLSSNGTPEESAVLQKGVIYEIIVTGTFNYDTTKKGSPQCSAQEYSEDGKNWKDDNAVSINGVQPDAEAYDPEKHIATYRYVGEGKKIVMKIVDKNYKDNFGFLDVKIIPVGKN